MLFLDLTARNNSCLCKTNTGLGWKPNMELIEGLRKTYE